MARHGHIRMPCREGITDRHGQETRLVGPGQGSSLARLAVSLQAWLGLNWRRRTGPGRRPGYDSGEPSGLTGPGLMRGLDNSGPLVRVSLGLGLGLGLG